MILQIFETIGKENIQLNAKQVDELLDLISKEEYLENEEKIQKALEKSKEEREQRKQEKAQIKAAEAAADDDVTALNKLDDEKHILDAEKTPTFDSTVSKQVTASLSFEQILIFFFSSNFHVDRAKKLYRRKLVIWI